MTDYQDQQIRELFYSLPTKLQGYILSERLPLAIQETAKKYQFSSEKYNIIEEEIILTLLGTSPATDISQHLDEQIDVRPETLSRIVKDIETEIFAEVRAELNEIYTQTDVIKGGLDAEKLATDEGRTELTEKQKHEGAKAQIMKEIEIEEKTEPSPNNKVTAPPTHTTTPSSNTPSIPAPKEPVPTHDKNESPQKSIFDQKVQDFYRAPKQLDNEGDSDLGSPDGINHDPYRETIT